MYKAYKFRIYPTKEQRVLINKNLGCKRFVYNHFLDKKKNTKKLYPYTCINFLNNNLKNEACIILSKENHCDKILMLTNSKNNLDIFKKLGFDSVDDYVLRKDIKN